MSFLSRAALVVAGAVSFTACDFLDSEPQGSLSSDIIFSDPAGAEAAINGAYSRTQGPMDDYVIFSDLAADWAQPTGSFPSWADVDNHSLGTDNAEAGQRAAIIRGRVVAAVRCRAIRLACSGVEPFVHGRYRYRCTDVVCSLPV